MASRVCRLVGDELRAARTAAGLSLRSLEAASGVSRSELSRIERAVTTAASVDELSRVAAALGLSLSVRLFAAGSPIRDAAQQALLARFRPLVHASVAWSPEVGIPIAGDRRAWDVMLRGAGWRLAVEGESRLGDIQAVERRIALKRRDDNNVDVVLLVNDTRHNRQVLATEREALRAMFPLDTRAVLAALRAGRHPGASGIVVL